MPSTKDTAHIRRSKGKKGNMVTFSNDLILDTKIDICLANPQNKQKFINNLRKSVSENVIQYLQAEGDADLLKVKTVVNSAIKY